MKGFQRSVDACIRLKMTLLKLDLGVQRELRAQALLIRAADEYCLCNFGKAPDAG